MALNAIDMLYKLLAGTGPTGYNPAIRHNLGLDIPTGGAQPVSGMTKYVPMPGVTGYKPKSLPVTPLKPLLPAYVAPKPPIVPVVPPVVPKVPVTPVTGGGGGGTFQWVNGQLVPVSGGFGGGANFR